MEERMIEEKPNKKEKKGKQKGSEKKMFVRTFAIALVIVMVIATPLFARVGEVLEMTPGDPDGPVLGDTVNFAELIPTDSPFFDAFVNTNRVNILLLGVDKHNLTDLIMLASFDIDNGFLDIISIPRDTFYYRPGFVGDAHHKINAAYNRNPVNSALAVSQTLMNIPINYYVSLSFQGVVNIIDSMGGVWIDVPIHMRYSDPFDTPPLHINIPAGYQLLDGQTSVHFLRFRSFPDQDLGRIRSQQQFMQAAVRQSLGMDLPNIIRTAFEEINSDITIREALYLSTRMIGMSSENIRTHTMPIARVDTFVHPDRQGIIDLLTEIYSMEIVDYSEMKYYGTKGEMGSETYGD